MRAAPLILAFLLVGCMDQPTQEAEAVPQEPLPPEPAPRANVTKEVLLPPPPTFVAAGVSWSQCDVRAATLAYKHEWAAGLVPSEYTQVNTIAGGVGQGALQLMGCNGLAVGNQTFLGAGQLAYFGVHVRPPRDVDGAGFHVYLLDLIASDARLADEMASVGIPASFGEAVIEGPEWAVSAPGFAVSGSEPRQTPSTMNLTSVGRLHWKTEAGRCWMPIEVVSDKLSETSVVVEGLEGSPEAISGGVGRLTGLGNIQQGSGSFGRPACVGGA